MSEAPEPVRTQIVQGVEHAFYARGKHPWTKDEFLKEWRKLGPMIPMADPKVPEYMPPKGVVKAVKQLLGLPVFAVGRATDHQGNVLYAIVRVA